MPVWRDYYLLTKPGIIRGNLIVVTGAYLLAAAEYDFSFLSLSGVIIGSIGIIASGCVFNNVLDRSIDKKMKRTASRALVRRAISLKSACVYGSLLGVLGLVSLVSLTNIRTAIIGALGFIFYVLVYGIFKRRGPIGTLVGSISGAVPPVAGYVAASNSFDLTTLLLFIILTTWQMPHFYAIALFRSGDYKSAGIPVLPNIKGVQRTKTSIIRYIVAFFIATLSLGLVGTPGYVYLVCIFAINTWWLATTIKGRNKSNTDAWAKKIFGQSIVVLSTFSLLIALSRWLP